MNQSERKAGKVLKAGKLVTAGGLFSRLIISTGPEKFTKIFQNKITFGALEIAFPNGEVRHIKGTRAGPEAKIILNRWRALRRLVLGGSVGFARSYIEDEWSTPDLVAVIELAARNRKTLNKRIKGARWIKTLNRLKHRFQANTRKGSRKNIQFHYDLGNDFYAAWLDPSMTYSSAIFKKGDNSLEAAQLRKYRKLLKLLGAKPGDRILEIGCGWGGFAETAASEFGVNVTGITLSQEQYKYALERVKKAGLEDKVSLRLKDYRDIRKTYDHVVSIEMFEAVGEEYWGTYFSKIHEVLKPGGKAALQIITIDDALFEGYRGDVDFIQTYIFPGGMLPSLSALNAEVAKAGLIWGKAKSYGEHYAKTLKEWRARFEEAYDKGRLPEDFDENFRKIWTYYLAYCEGGFRGGSINVLQLQLSKI